MGGPDRGRVDRGSESVEEGDGLGSREGQVEATHPGVRSAHQAEIGSGARREAGHDGGQGLGADRPGQAEIVGPGAEPGAG